VKSVDLGEISGPTPRERKEEEKKNGGNKNKIQKFGTKTRRGPRRDDAQRRHLNSIKFFCLFEF
jgi:hypothetical protein